MDLSQTTHLAEQLFEEHSQRIVKRTDRLFVRLMLFQWLAGIVTALVVSPRTWAGTSSSIHVHVWAAVFLGGLITLVPVAVASRWPGTPLSRHTIAIGQTLTSALLIHLSGGRIETHFHVFGSLAFLAFYRDWRVLVTASTVVAIDHCLRGIFWPQSVFGALVAARWRWIEHAAWVVFEDVFLLRSCFQGIAEMKEIAQRRASLEQANLAIEAEVLERTHELVDANHVLKAEMAQRAGAERERDELTQQLVHASKLEAVGKLAAGIAHEINTPTQFVGDNTRFLQESFGELAPLLRKAAELAQAVREERTSTDLARDLESSLEEADLEYLAEEIPHAIAQSLEGIARVSKIVLAMKEFSHPGVEGTTMLDLNHAIESTITVASNEWKYVARVETDFDPELPPVPCLPDELNQVILNVIVNAAHAIADVVGDGAEGKGTIVVRTRCDGDHAEVRISDTGTGIPEAVRGRVFDPFFTTKDVGKGTGQGLSIAHGVIVRKHGGTLDFETEMGEGTTFIIRLPLERADAMEATA